MADMEWSATNDQWESGSSTSQSGLVWQVDSPDSGLIRAEQRSVGVPERKATRKDAPLSEPACLGVV